jgi:alanyl-tRNA synthetase
MMNSSDIRSRYLSYFSDKGHTVIPSASLVPENDPTTLFTSSGMQPLVPYLLGQPHPSGKRLVNAQRSFRSGDIEEVGDNRHTTFFEMLGNWSLGDYFKKEQLPWFFEFLTQEVGLDPKRLYVTVFEGNQSVPKDEESMNIWKNIFSAIGIEAKIGERIFAYPAKKNWWSRSGEPENMPPGEPGGPDSEVFFDFGEELHIHEQSPWKNEKCHPNCDCGRFMEIGNSVFMQYQKQEDGSLSELPNTNVDFGGGLERITASANNNKDVFTTDLFTPIIDQLESISKIPYHSSPESTKAMQVIADHIKAGVMMMADGVLPGNKQQGYILRRLIRRSLLYGRRLGLANDWKYIGKLVEPVAQIYESAYPSVVPQIGTITLLLEEEALRFGKTLEKGLREIEKCTVLDGTVAFSLYETYGFPWEMTAEIATDRGQTVDHFQFENEFKKHQQLSRSSAAGMFKGGLADHSAETTRLHTAHHLLLATLQKVIDPHIKQRGSNITVERLRIDINTPKKITPEDMRKVEELVNQKINEAVPVVRYDMKKEDADKTGAQMEFGQKYPYRVSVYFVGLDPKVKPENATPHDYFSAEFCGGPHVANTKELAIGGKKFKIQKEENIGSGVRRIKAILV